MPRVPKPTGLKYGEGKQLADAQAAVPISGAATPSTRGASGAPQAGPQDRMAQALQAAQAMQSPGQGMLAAPSARPNEPVTAGLPIGPGAGPEAMQQVVPAPPSDDWMMASYLPALEAMADRPDATVALRNYVRTVRGKLNSGVTQDIVAAQRSGQ